MLIVTRRIGERLLIGQDVWVTVLRINGNQVRLGVDAPAGVKVQREEIVQRLDTDGQAIGAPRATSETPKSEP